MKKTQLLYVFILTILLTCLWNSNLFSQRTIKGTIFKDGKPAPAATVTAHRSSASYFTSFDGKYEIEVHDKSKWIKVSLIEEDKKVDIGESDVLDVYFGKKPDENDQETDNDVESSAGKASSGPDFGSDPTLCKRNLSLYKDNLKGRKYKEALAPWRKALEVCPASTKNLYIDGVKILQYFAQEDEENKDMYIDELMDVYDQRIEYYGQKGFVLGRKGVDLLKFRLQDVEKSYDYLQKSIEIRKNKSEDAVLASFMQATVGMYKLGKIDEDQVISNFETISSHLEYKMKNADSEKDMVRAKTALNGVEELFAVSGAANCEAIASAFSPKLNESPEDVELLKKITSFLMDAGCEQETELYAKSAEKLYELEPSAEAAFKLAKLFVKKEQLDKAISYYRKAIELEEDLLIKSDYHYQLANVLFVKKQYPEARKEALLAAKSKEGWGMPYILIGKMYATSSKMCANDQNIDGEAVFWLAVDMFIKAKQVDPDVSLEADKLISDYKQYYPNKEKAFFYGITENQRYTVGCWINETTTVRF